MPRRGSTAAVRTTIPIPPSQCVRDLQKSIHFGSDSIWVRIDAPVVVYPDMVSKKASAKEGIDPERKKGRQPNKEAPIQLAVTRRKPSLVVILPGGCRNRISINVETPPMVAMGMRKYRIISFSR